MSYGSLFVFFGLCVVSIPAITILLPIIKAVSEDPQAFFRNNQNTTEDPRNVDCRRDRRTRSILSSRNIAESVKQIEPHLTKDINAAEDVIEIVKGKMHNTEKSVNAESSEYVHSSEGEESENQLEEKEKKKKNKQYIEIDGKRYPKVADKQIVNNVSNSREHWVNIQETLFLQALEDETENPILNYRKKVSKHLKEAKAKQEAREIKLAKQKKDAEEAKKARKAKRIERAKAAKEAWEAKKAKQILKQKELGKSKKD